MSNEKSTAIHVSYMQKAFATAANFLTIVKNDPTIENAKIFEARSRTYNFTMEAASQVNTEALKDMIEDYVKSEFGFKSILIGIVTEQITSGGRAYEIDEAGVFRTKKSETDEPVKPLVLRLGGQKLMALPIEIITLMYHSVTDPATKKVYKSQESYLSQLISYFSFYFAKSIVKYLRDFSHADKAARTAIIAKHNFCDNDKISLKQPTFGKDLGTQITEKLNAHKGAATQIINLVAGDGAASEKQVGNVFNGMASALDVVSRLFNGTATQEELVNEIASLSGKVTSLASGRNQETTPSEEMII